MTWAVWPAGVLGPVIGWIRLSITLPLVAASLATLKGAWSQPQTWAVLAACGAVLSGTFARIRTRWPVYAVLNLTFAAMLVLWAEFWHSVTGVWCGALGGLTGGVFLIASDSMARLILCRLAGDNPVDCTVSAVIEIGVLWGFVEVTSPTIVVLRDESNARLAPGCRYAWWLGAESKEPRDLLVAVGGGGESSAN